MWECECGKDCESAVRGAIRGVTVYRSGNAKEAISMKMYLISDNVDTYTGMRLAGVDGVVVHGKNWRRF